MDTDRGTPPPSTGEPAVLMGGPYAGVHLTTMPGIHRIAVQVGDGGDTHAEVWYERTPHYQEARRVYVYQATEQPAAQRGGQHG